MSFSLHYRSLISLISLLLAFSFQTAFPATYYVNNTSGSNSAAGTSAGTAWKTCPGMNYSGGTHTGHSLSPGDIVYFAPGQVWAGSVSGSGSASSLLLLTGGVTYKADTSVYNPDSVTSGTRAILRASGTMNNAIVQFRDHPTIETVIDNLELDGNSQITQGIDINHRYAIATSMAGTWKKILNCYIHDMLGDMAHGNYKYGISGRTNVENVLIEHTEVFNPPRECIVAYSDDGTYINNWIVRHCFVHGDSSDGQPRGSIATGQYLNGSGLCLKGDVRNAILEYNTVYNIRSQGIYIFNNTVAGSSPSNFTIRYNVVHSNGHSGNGGTGVFRIEGNLPKSGNIYGNIILPAADLAADPGLYQSSGGLFTGNVYNNTILCNNGNGLYLANFTGQVKNNLVIGTGAAITGGTQSNNVTASSYAGFKSVGNVPTAAFFTGTYPALAPNHDGLSVLSGAAVNGGANLGTSYNGTIDSGVREASGAWDIGAYDLQATGGGGGGSDTTGPVIAALADTSTASTTGYVSFTTDEAATVVIDYGLTTSYGAQVTATANTSFNVRISGLTAGTLYHYKVTATDAASNATQSSDGTFSTLALPVAPSGLGATTQSATQINLAWTDNSALESGYLVERSLTSGTGFSQIASKAANSTSHNDSALNASTAYFYRVRATVTRDGTTDNSAYAAEASATTASPSDTTGPVVSNRGTTTGSSTSHYVTWTTDESATGYVEYGTTGSYGAQTTTSALTTNHSHRITGLSANTLYHYRIVATDAASNATTTTDGTFTTLALPATPTGAAANAVSDTQITVTWTDAATVEDAYQVRRAATTGGALSVVGTLASNAISFTDSGLTPSEDYFYKVRCSVTRDGLTDYSADATEVSDTTDASGPGPDVTPPVISGQSGAAGSSKSLTVTWTTDEACTGFIEYGSTASYGTSSGATGLGTSHSVRLTGYEAGNQVYWRINSVDTAGNAATVRPTGSTTTLAWPTAPTSFAATAAGPSTITLTWTDGVTGEDGFRIWRSTTADVDASFTELTTTAANATSYSDTTGAPLTLYYYRIRTIDTRDQIEDRSELASASATTLPAQPTGQKPRPGWWRRAWEAVFGK